MEEVAAGHAVPWPYGENRAGHALVTEHIPLVASRRVTIILHLPPDGHVHVVRAMWRINRRAFSAIWAAGAILAGYGGLSLVYAWPARQTLGTYLYVVIAWGLLLLVVPWWMMWRFQQRLTKVPDEACVVTINEERIYVVSQSVNLDFTWTLIGSVLETRDSFVLRQGGSLRAALPKSEFVGDDLAAFRRLLVSLRLV